MPCTVPDPADSARSHVLLSSEESRSQDALVQVWKLTQSLFGLRFEQHPWGLVETTRGDPRTILRVTAALQVAAKNLHDEARVTLEPFTQQVT